MQIAFDAKRAFENDTGLGNYVRILTASFFKDYPQHQYYMVAPKITDYYSLPDADNIHMVRPMTLTHNIFSGLWRSKLVTKELEDLKIDLYHGMSHEMPRGLQHTSVKSIVTMHDLIFERYPKQYNPIDVQIYRSKFKYACLHANKLITVSKQTKQDLIDIYHTPEDKIEVCYPSCEKMYLETITEEDKIAVKEKYDLPDKFFLSVGSVIERKNLLLICQAMYELNGRLDIRLVVIGRGDSYMKKVKEYIRKHKLTDKIIFLSEHPQSSSDGFRKSTDFPAIYQLSQGLIYPTIFEGFGLPVLEGLFSKIPVITSNISCMPETGGDAAFYIDPFGIDSLADAMMKVGHDDKLRDAMITKGIVHASNFTQEACAARVMRVYESMF